MTSTQFSRGVVFYLGVLLLGTPFPAHADVYRWDTFVVIPGTEGIEPGPGVQLDHRELQYANLLEMDLSGANFEASNLSVAHLIGSTLTNADFAGAVVARTMFPDVTSSGFTKGPKTLNARRWYRSATVSR